MRTFTHVLTFAVSAIVLCGAQGCAREPESAPTSPLGGARGARVYVSNEPEGSVSVIDASANRLLATVPVGKRPRGIRVSRDGSRVYVALSGSPIAGLMSDQPAETLIAQQHALHAATRSLGCPHADPFMPLSFMPLPVIPKLKLSDKGLVDVEKFEIVPLMV